MDHIKLLKLILILIVCIHDCSGFTVAIVASREKCFHQVATEGQRLYGSYAVQFGGKLDLNVKVNDPDNELVFETKLQKEESFEFIAQKNGRYELCLNNQRTSVSTKRVSFQFRVSNEIKNAGLHVSKHFGSLESAISKIGVGVHSIQDHHHYMAIRDKFARETNLSTLSRVSWMCSIEVLAILCLCAFQIFYIHRMFSQKR